MLVLKRNEQRTEIFQAVHQEISGNRNRSGNVEFQIHITGRAMRRDTRKEIQMAVMTAINMSRGSSFIGYRMRLRASLAVSARFWAASWSDVYSSVQESHLSTMS